jgi:hypothetical protein
MYEASDKRSRAPTLSPHQSGASPSIIGLTPKPFKAGLPQGSPASPILLLIYANAIINPTICMNDHLESECTYIDDITMVQAATKTDNAIFRLKTRSKIQIDRAKILHARYSPVKSDLMFCFPTSSAFKKY